VKGHVVALTTGVAVVLILAVLATIVVQTQQNAIAHPGQPRQSGAGGRTAGGSSGSEGGEASGIFANGCGWCAAGRYYWALTHLQNIIHR
jgi:hypothetical protein